MADADHTTARDEPPGRPGSFLRRVSPPAALLLALVWWVQSFPRTDAWLVGTLAVAAGVLLHMGLGGRQAPFPRPRGVLAFAPFFLDRMVRGGLDVSRRALAPSLPLDPDFIRYRTRLPPGLVRVFFINAISLLPGTFSAGVDDDQITVHRLDPALAPEDTLETLEEKVAGLFGL